jgi:hypothetical protein
MTAKKKAPAKKRDEAPAVEEPKVAKQPTTDPETIEDQIRAALAETYTPAGIERVLAKPVRALGNVTPIDAIYVGEGQHVLAWAKGLAE